jgi:hypothetical protein
MSLRTGPAIRFPPRSTRARFAVDASLATDSTAGRCNAEPTNPEVVGWLTLTASRRVRVTATAAPHRCSTAWDETSGSGLACDDASPPGPAGRSPPLHAGTSFLILFVESFGPGGAGPSVATVTRSP